MIEKDEILIDAYLRGVLSAEDKVLLDERLNDNDFKQKYDEPKLLLQVLKEEDVKQMKVRMQSIERNEFGNRDSKGISQAIKLGILVLLIILGVLTYFLIFDIAENKQELYPSYYEAYPNAVDPIVKGQANSSSLYQYYELKDYPQVIEMLTTKGELNLDEQFYLASAYLGENDLVNASNLFELLRNTEKYANPSEWYLALICIKTEKSSCIEIFDSIASDKSNIYSDKAKELLKVL